MEAQAKPMFPRLRLLMMLFMLFSMASSLSLTASAAPTQADLSDFGAFQTAPTVEMCWSLDTSGDLNLTPNEIAAFDVDLDGNGTVNDADRDAISIFCAAQTSITTGPMVTICHALGSGTEREYEVITASSAAIYSGHYGPSHQDGRDIIPPFTYQGQTYSQNWDEEGQLTWNNDCIWTPPPPDTYTFTVTKYFCTVDDEEVDVPEPQIGNPDNDCVVATDQDFTLSLDGYTYTTAELLAGVELEAGTYDLYEGQTYLGEIVVVDEDVDVDVLNFVGDEEAYGTVIVEKYFCDDDDIDAPVIGEPEAFDDCVAGTAEFDLLDDTLANGGTSVLEEGDDLFAGVDVPFGTYYLVEWFEGDWVEMATVVVGPNDTVLTYTVINPGEEETVNLDIYKGVCKDVDVSDEENPCIPSIVLDGQTIEFVALALDSEGEVIAEVDTSLMIEDDLGSAVVEGLPEADFYAVCEVVPEGVETIYIYSLPSGELFEVEDLAACILIAGDDIDDSLIEVLFLNDMEDEKPEEPEEPGKPEEPEKPEKPDVVVPQKPAPTVTGLPDTGSGPAGTTSTAPWIFLGGAAVLASMGVILRKDHRAA